MAVARPQLFFFHILPIRRIKQKRSLGFYWQDRVNDEEKQRKRNSLHIFWQHRVCEVVRFHAWVQPAHQFGFGNVQRISQVKNTTGESTKAFAKLKTDETLLKVDLSTKSIVSRWWSERRGFLIVRLLKRKIGLPIVSTRAAPQSFRVCCAIFPFPPIYIYLPSKPLITVLTLLFPF